MIWIPAAIATIAYLVVVYVGRAIRKVGGLVLGWDKDRPYRIK